ncbi:TolC family protein [Spirosoma sp. KUDC1026]|uniref:TolC family protein n=1 Tax=Spirosoma sp. KUDC1026 TaxID=2745947 RepID=UPI00159BCB8C|nr:TolC family protein [Spirosoma sp. KUDC1026]QKZ14381.1 TolC family protein [Spirosoma sp. KUDC1026]
MRLLVFFIFFISSQLAWAQQPVATDLLHSSANGQDSLRLTLRQADSLFLKNNLLLLAERFRLDASQAQIIQAGLYDNPTVTVELSAYNAEKRRVLDAGRQGQKFVAIEQLLYTAGKRNKRVALASEAARLTGYELLDLLRGLRFELRSRFYSVYFQELTLARFDQQLATLQTTVTAYERQYERNNVSLRELLRLKALLFQLGNDRTEILFQLADDQRSLRTLLTIDQPLRPVVRNAALPRYRIPTQSEDSLQQLALQNRPDLLAAGSLTKQAELNYNLQRALAVPDVRVGGNYDQASNYINNYVGLSVSTDLPVFNRNQGAIKAAKSQIGYQTQLQRQKTIQVANEVATSIQKVQEVERRVQSVETRFTEQFDQLNQGVIISFQKGNLTLLEFVDLIEAYNDSVRQLNRLRADRVSAYEELNYLLGTDLFQ